MSKQRQSKTSLKKESSDSTEPIPEPMTTSEIRGLIDFIAKSGLNEVNIETKELKLHVKREPDQKVFKAPLSGAAATPVSPAVPPVQFPVAPNIQAPPAKPQESISSPTESSGAKKTVEIRSPMIGTFYRSSSPDSPPLVSVGDQITKGQTVCIIEAMKLFNEIDSEVSGTIVKAMVENATPVEYDQVLFVVEAD